MLSATDYAREVIQQLFAFILAQGNTDYLGERVSQLEHSLQCAHLARQSTEHGQDPEVILGALLHDVGRFIPDSRDMPKMIAPDGAYIGRASHEVLGERYLRQLGFGEKVCQLVGSHVMAKRYLTAVEEEYYNGLSETSKRTLRYQGGIFSEEQIEEARKDPWLEAKLAVRRWDDQAKVPDMKVPDLGSYEELAVEYLSSARSRIIVDSRPYSVPKQPSLIISIPEELFGAALDDQVLSEARKSEGWIMQRVRPSANDKISVEQNVLDQLTRRGVRVAIVSSGRGATSPRAKGVISFSAENGLESSLPEGVDNLQAWLGLGVPSQNSVGRAEFAINAATKFLGKDMADLVLLEISDMLSVDSFVGQLIQAKHLCPNAVVAITAETPDFHRGEDVGQTIFDSILPPE